jgi:tetratricopeptide (TPR) repeat protein
MYPISHHSNASSATLNMNLTIEKCRKAIKLHSIKAKPKKDMSKMGSPEYKLFMSQQEYNPALIDAWLLLAKAEFHKGDFLGSVGTFSYIVRHYANDKNVETICQLWMTRAYAEMGWLFEAEQMLSNVSQKNLKVSNTGFFAAVNADLLVKKHQYKEAISFLELALKNEPDKVLQQRFGYLLAQLYHLTKDDKAAFAAYSKVMKLNPPYEMEFNARISRAQLDQGNINGVRKELNGMLKNRNNKEYLDQLYYALGNTYLHHADTLKAIENYKLSAEKSTRKGIDKAVDLITLGDIYYTKRDYVLAKPCYEEAGKIITNENEDYARVTKRGEMLGELVTQYNVVVLQDSLQRLSAMPEAERLKVVNKIIAKLIADEKTVADKAMKEKQAANELNFNDNFPSVAPIGNNASGNWYFYNVDVVRSGESDFLKKWGKRQLEDNWRRTNKSTSLFAEENRVKAVAKDSTDTVLNSKNLTDNKKPEFYLSQIPTTKAQLEKSSADIADALFAMGQIYKDKIEDIPMSINTFKDFIKRFPADKRVADAYFYLYLMETRNGNQNEADVFRNKLIKDFPDTKYQKILSQPDYNDRLSHMFAVQDSIYNLTYKAYTESDYATVFKQVAFIRKNYPLSTLMPKFLFLNALSVGKNETPELFKTTLNDLVKSYPQSDVSAMAKDILALISQGKEAQTGTSSGSLLARREITTEKEINEISSRQFSDDKLTKHRLLLINSLNKEQTDKLLYNIASFNFSRFLIKDFDLGISKLDSVQNVLYVTNFESYDEVTWYLNSLNSDALVTKMISDNHIQKVIISDDNYALLNHPFSLKDYLAFQSDRLEKSSAPQTTENKKVVKQEHGLVLKEMTAQNQVEVSSKPEINQTHKPVELADNKKEVKAAEKPIELADNKKEVKAVEKPVEKPKVKAPDKMIQNQISPVKQKIAVKPAATVSTVQPKQETVPLYKGLFAYKAEEPHFIAIYILSGTIDFAKIKAAFDAYNATNYGIMNLKVSLETGDKSQVILIGSLTDALVAKSYLLRMVKENNLFDGLKGTNYRNLLGSQKNLNIVIHQNALKEYYGFMEEYYLK